MLVRRWEVLIIFAGVFALFSGLLFAVSVGLIDSSVVIASGATLLAAFLGAYLAFVLNERREIAKKRLENKVAFNRSLFVLARQSNAIENYKRLIGGYRSDIARALTMPAFNPPSYVDLSHDFDGLAFLLEYSEPQVLMELSIEQERFEQVVDSIQIRNEFYVNEVQPALISNGLTKRVTKAEEVSRVLGERIFGGAMSGAKTVHEHVMSTSKSLLEMHKRLRKVAVELFPGERFVAWDIEEDQTDDYLGAPSEIEHD